MEPQKINWDELTESQKVSVLQNARAYLHQRKEEEKMVKSAIPVLVKHGII